MCYYYPLYKIVNYYYYYYRGAIEFSHSNTYSSLCEKVFYLVLRYYEKKRKEKMKNIDNKTNITNKYSLSSRENHRLQMPGPQHG